MVLQRLRSGVMLLLLATVSLSALTVLAPRANAGALTNSYVRLNRMAAGSTAGGRVVFKTAGAGATSVAINFNGADTTTWTGSSGLVNAAQTTSVATCPGETGVTALPGTLAASGAGSTITITGVTALSASTSYCVDLTSASAVTDATAGEYHPTITAGSDSTTVAVRTVSNDQIVVSAVVPPTFNFVLDNNTDNFTGNLSPSSVVSTGGRTVTVNTNAKTGWIAWAKDSSTGLNSASQAKTIASTTPGTTASLSAGSEGYIFGITSITQGSGAGTTTAATAYDATAGGGNNASGSGLDSTIRQIASSNGTASGAVLTVKERAAVASTTPAGSDYTDTVTVIGAGSF
jgi:hypothetical protein